ERRERRHQTGGRLRRGPRPGPHLENDLRDSRRCGGQALRGAFFRRRIVAVRGRSRERVHPRGLARAQGRPGVRHARRLCAGRGSGLSAALARLFAREGMHVAAAARDTAKLGPLAKETGALALACDAADPVQVEAMFAAVETKWGVPELVVYNAGYRVRGPF